MRYPGSRYPFHPPGEPKVSASGPFGRETLRRRTFRGAPRRRHHGRYHTLHPAAHRYLRVDGFVRDCRPGSPGEGCQQVWDYPGTGAGSRLYLLEDIVEKPKPEKAPSRFGSIGRYVFTPTLFSCFEQVTPGVGGEVQLTDTIRQLMKKEDVYVHYPGRRVRYRGKARLHRDDPREPMEDEGMPEELREFIRKRGI